MRTLPPSVVVCCCYCISSPTSKLCGALAVYTQDTRLAQAFVWGDSHQASLVAIFVVDPATFTEWANSKGFKGDSKALVRDAALTKILLEELNKGARARGLQAFECVRVHSPLSLASFLSLFQPACVARVSRLTIRSSSVTAESGSFDR